MRVSIKTELLNWALVRARIFPDSLYNRFPKLDEWLEGETAPTLKQLEAFAKATHVPIGYLFLQEPPQEDVPIPDFRTINQDFRVQPSPNLLDTIYLCQQRQEWYQNFARLHSEIPFEYVGKANLNDDIVRVAAEMRHAIDFGLDKRHEIPTWTDALRRFIKEVENLGVLVMVSGVVGSNNKRKLDPDEFRGFALADELAPLIFINASDTKAAQMFTLGHELAHIWLGKSGVSDPQMAMIPDEETERWCNAVAAELLVPLDNIRQIHDPRAELQEEIQRLARMFKVSTLVILRRLSDAGTIDQETLWTTYRDELARLTKFVRKGTGGGDFYRTLGVRVSKRFARALVGSTLEGQTLFKDAFRMLGIRKPDTFYHVAKQLGVK